MPIPDYQTIMLPLLRFLEDGKVRTLAESIEHLAKHFSLTEDEKKERVFSGQQTLFYNRTTWSRMYLKKAGLIEDPMRGLMKITPKGIDVLNKNPKKIDTKFLEQFPQFVEFRNIKKDDNEVEEKETYTKETPQELLEIGYKKIKQELSQELLKTVKTASPEFFEKLVVDLLLKIGYGGSLKDAGKAIGKSGDEGIDGIIKEDKLGLDTIYIQAKRWDGTVGRPEIHKFVGALTGQGATKGIFITTSNFSKDALDYANHNKNPKIVLIDGEHLAQLMIDNNIGVSRVVSYDIKKVDSDYFVEE